MQTAFLILSMRIPVAVQSKAWVWGRFIAGIASSNPLEELDVRLLGLLCFV